jgi:hypothetical protein
MRRSHEMRAQLAAMVLGNNVGETGARRLRVIIVAVRSRINTIAIFCGY